jgi:hypothetical protein
MVLNHARISNSGKFIKGDKIEVDCQLIWLEGYRNILKPGVKFKLWDAGFFATGIVTKIFDTEKSSTSSF